MRASILPGVARPSEATDSACITLPATSGGVLCKASSSVHTCSAGLSCQGAPCTAQWCCQVLAGMLLPQQPPQSSYGRGPLVHQGCPEMAHSLEGRQPCAVPSLAAAGSSANFTPSPLPLIPNPAAAAPPCLCSQPIPGPTMSLTGLKATPRADTRRRATLQMNSQREVPESTDHTQDPQRSPPQLGRARPGTHSASYQIPAAAG